MSYNNSSWMEETLGNMTTLQIFRPIFPLRVGTFFAAPVIPGIRVTTTSTTEGAKDRASCVRRCEGEEEVEEISISGSFPCSHAHFSISQLNIIYEFPPTLDNNLNLSRVMSVNECFQDLIKYKLKINYNHYISNQTTRQDQFNIISSVISPTGLVRYSMLDIDHSESQSRGWLSCLSRLILHGLI